jgi:hypothetical protein
VLERDGGRKYTIHFDTAPPADAFWSITLYDQEGFPVANPLNRFAPSSWMPFRYNLDGSLDLYFQNESPGPLPPGPCCSTRAISTSATSSTATPIAPWMPLRFNADGSLDIYLQAESPGKDKESNWLPTPPGQLNLTPQRLSEGSARPRS